MSPEPKSRRVAGPGPGVTAPTLAFSTVPAGAMTAVTAASAFAVGVKAATANNNAAIPETALTLTSLPPLFKLSNGPGLCVKLPPAP